jgi:hypothetical protein
MQRSLVARTLGGLALLVGVAGCAMPGGSDPAAAPTSQSSANPNDPDPPQFVAYRDVATQSHGADPRMRWYRPGRRHVSDWVIVRQMDGDGAVMPDNTRPVGGSATTTTDGS